MKNKMAKRIFATAMALIIVLAGWLPYSGQEVKAADASVVYYEDFDYEAFSGYVGQSAPKCELTNKDQGYLFAGWYKDNEGKNPIKAVADVNESDNGTVYAKFVSASVAGIACQVKADINETNVNKTSLRAVSPVHSSDYKAVGFNVYGHGTINGKFQDWTMYEYKEDGSNRAQFSTVYEKLLVYNADGSEHSSKTPKDVFGAQAEGDFYFNTVNLQNINSDLYGLTMAVQPYWITLDGVYVEGMAEFNCANDGKPAAELDKVVNISVNLKEAGELAAGMLNISYDSDRFTYVGYEIGRTFDEMEVNSDTAGVVKCVGNVKNIEDNSANPEDVYINLKFKKTENNTYKPGEAVFTITIPEEGFCDVNEKTATVKAWNVKY